MMRIWTDDGLFLTLKGHPDWTSRWNQPFITGETSRGERISIAIAHIVRYEEVDG